MLKSQLVLQHFNRMARFTGTIVLATSSLIATPALAEKGHPIEPLSTDATETESLTCQQPLNQPVALVIDPSLTPDASQGRYEAQVAYGSLDAFPDAKIVMLVPQGQELSDTDLAAIEGKGWGRNFFVMLVPAIAQEVIETYLEENTRPVFRSRYSNSGNFQVRSIAREACLNVTWGFGAAWGICDFFGDMIDQVVNEVREYYQRR